MSTEYPQYNDPLVKQLKDRIKELEEEAKNLRLSLADANNALSARENEDMGG